MKADLGEGGRGLLSSLTGYLLRAAFLTAVDRIVSSPLYRWTWRPLTGETFFARLPEIRPADPLSVGDMIDGKYLLASRLIETGGVSPFSVETDDPAWLEELHGFSWLRHFADLKEGADRAFARTLVLDWIGRHGRFDRKLWASKLAAKRVQNWLTHYELIAGGAAERQRSMIARCLAAQAQALNQRGRLDPDPLGRLFAAIGLVAVGVSQKRGLGQIARRAGRLAGLLRAQLDSDGLHRTRSAKNQYELLEYLAPVRLALVMLVPDQGRALASEIERMHAALAALTLTTGEPAYFNGTGQLPLELLLAVQSHGGQRAEGDMVRAASGYGVLQQGRGKLIADAGLMPGVEYSAEMHAGALGFEFGYGNELIAGNCGPAPAQLTREAEAFRHSAAHSTLDMGRISSARFGLGPMLKRHAFARTKSFPVKCDPGAATIEMGTVAYEARHGLRHARALSLIDAGQTLIGQDILTPARRGRRAPTPFALRFHLGPGARAHAEDAHALIRIATRSGQAWVFLCEGAEAAIEPSVRQSLHYGLLDTQQIVLRGTFSGRLEIAWSFARQAG